MRNAPDDALRTAPSLDVRLTGFARNEGVAPAIICCDNGFVYAAHCVLIVSVTAVRARKLLAAQIREMDDGGVSCRR